AVVAKHYFLVWDLLETVLMTVRHKGYHKGVVFFTDERCLDTVPSFMENYYLSYPPLPSADVLARHSSDKWKPVLSLAEKLPRIQLEPVELVSLEQMLFATYGTCLLSRRFQLTVSFQSPSFSRTTTPEENLRTVFCKTSATTASNIPWIFRSRSTEYCRFCQSS
ncbi:hypothetical protein AAVH_40279, partial [Aphelenchoides avenae]